MQNVQYRDKILRNISTHKTLPYRLGTIYKRQQTFLFFESSTHLLISTCRWCRAFIDNSSHTHLAPHLMDTLATLPFRYHRYYLFTCYVRYVMLSPFLTATHRPLKYPNMWCPTVRKSVIHIPWISLPHVYPSFNFFLSLLKYEWSHFVNGPWQMWDFRSATI